MTSFLLHVFAGIAAMNNMISTSSVAVDDIVHNNIILKCLEQGKSKLYIYAGVKENELGMNCAIIYLYPVTESTAKDVTVSVQGYNGHYVHGYNRKDNVKI